VLFQTNQAKKAVRYHPNLETSCQENISNEAPPQTDELRRTIIPLLEAKRY